MNAEMRRITPTEAWMAWENQVVNGVFPLRRFLGSSDHSAVFLTEYKAQTLIEAAIKFVPTDSLRADAQLVQWGAAATVTHPHLVRLFDMGRFQFGGHGFLYVVMEYAEQTLAQVLPRRALTSDETRDMLRPTLDTLAFLHRNHLVHSRLKPTNLLVVNDQLKLASDTIRPTGVSANRFVRTSVYDAPELRDGVASPASDLWSLGITLVEALTQRAPMWPDERGETIVPIEEVPEPFAHTVRHCLSRTPTNRPTVEDLEAEYKPAPQAGEPAPSSADETSTGASPPQNPARPSLLVPAIITALVIFVGSWVFLRSHATLPISSQDKNSSGIT
jgi:serine/threonine protein kinase